MIGLSIFSSRFPNMKLPVHHSPSYIITKILDVTVALVVAASQFPIWSQIRAEIDTEIG